MGKENKLARSKNASAASSKNKMNTATKVSLMYTATKVSLIVIALILVATLSIVFIQSSGLVLRTNTVLESENYKVSGSMMQYMVNAQYQSFYSNYSAYGSSLFGIDFTKSIRTQAIDTTKYVYVTMILGDEYKDFKGTWYDYFWQTSYDQMESTLMFCEAAKAAGVELDDEDKAKIDETIENLRLEMENTNKENRDAYEKYYGKKNYVTFRSLSQYVSACYGVGVKVSDIRKVLELYSLSEKYYNQASDEMLEAIKADKDGTIKFYNEKPNDYLKADYLSFTFSASYTKPTTDTEANRTKAWNEYLTAINKAMDNAKELAACETEEAFKTYMIEYWFESLWQTQYDKTIKELKGKKVEDGGLTDKDIPAADVVAEKKATALKQITDALLNDKEEYELEPSGKGAFDGAIDAIRNSLFTTISGSSYYGGLEKVKNEYADSTDKDKWTFSEDRKDGDSKYFASADVEFIGSETTAPEETSPETTAPEATAPETTAPETTAAAAPVADEPESTPAESTPVESTPVESTPVESTPVESTPVESTPAESTPVETTPAPDPNWDVDVDADSDEDKSFTVEVRFITASRYRLDKNVLEFGHILITPETFKKVDGKELSEAEQHAKALAKAEELLEEFKKGEITKEAFEALAKDNNEDSNVFYSEVAEKDMVPSVNDWAFAEDRAVGDTAVVKSEYGYHVMYLTEITEDAGWFIEARDARYEKALEDWVAECENTYGVTAKNPDFAKKNLKLINE